MPPSVHRVLLDVTAVPADRGGVGRYVDSLVPALAAADIDVLVACRRADTQLYASLGAHPMPVSDRLRSAPLRLAWEQSGLPAMAARVRPDVLHSPHYTMPVAYFGASAVTLHDATFFTDPGLHSRTKGPFFRNATRLALKRADVGIVPSQATADELARVARADAARMKVAYHGVDRAVFHPPLIDDVARVRSELGIASGTDYIAFLGTLEPRKNLSALVRGYVQAFRDRENAPVLVLAGGKGWDDELDGAVAAAPPTLRVLRPGYLPLSDLPSLLGGARIVAYPSLGEGFGLPVLEAMACEAVVLTTRRLSLPEVGGDAVAYTDVDDASIARELTSLFDDPARCAELRTAAGARAARFTWQACAAAHIEAYEMAIHRHGAR